MCRPFAPGTLAKEADVGMAYDWVAHGGFVRYRLSGGRAVANRALGPGDISLGAYIL